MEIQLEHETNTCCGEMPFFNVIRRFGSRYRPPKAQGRFVSRVHVSGYNQFMTTGACDKGLFSLCSHTVCFTHTTWVRKTSGIFLSTCAASLKKINSL